MKSLRPKNPIETIFAISAWIIIPCFSIYLGTRESIFYENITFIGNQENYKMLFQIWGTFISIVYVSSFLYLLFIGKHYETYMIPISITLGILNIISFFIPYEIGSNSFISQMHVFCALIGSVGTLIMILSYIVSLRFVNPHFYIHYFKIFSSFLLLCGILLLTLGDISSLLEIIMATFLSNFLYYMIKATE